MGTFRREARLLGLELLLEGAGEWVTQYHIMAVSAELLDTYSERRLCLRMGGLSSPGSGKAASPV